jgi:chitinase
MQKALVLLLALVCFSLQEEKLPYRNVIYYGEWSIYPGQNYFYPSKMNPKYITHLNFAFLDLDSNGDLVMCDEYADFQITTLPELSGINYGAPYAGVLGAIAILKIKYPNLKVGISVGGWTRSGDFSAVAADETKRNNFAKNIVKFINYLGYDFVDIDWEYPTDNRAPDPAGNGVQVDEGCPGKPEDGKNFILLLKAIRKKLNSLEKSTGKYYELSVAMSASPNMMEKVNYKNLLKTVDFANMMTYDLNGAWGDFTAHHTALYTNEAYDKNAQGQAALSVDHCIKYLEKKYKDKIDYSKIVVGVAPYTRGWAGVQNNGRDPNCPGLYATAQANSVKGADGTTAGTFGFWQLNTIKSQHNLKEYWDDKAKAAYYYSPSTGYFFTMDNEKSVKEKGKYVKKKKLGGLIAWMASHDPNNIITKTMFESLYGSGYSLPAVKQVTSVPKAQAEIKATDWGYDITIKNLEKSTESNAALRNAELFKKSLLYMKLYIKSKSGAQFSAGSMAGSVTNQNGWGVVDPSSMWDAKNVAPGGSFTFSLRTSNNKYDVSDIQTIKMTQRILQNLGEFKEQVIYGK